MANLTQVKKAIDCLYSRSEEVFGQKRECFKCDFGKFCHDFLKLTMNFVPKDTIKDTKVPGNHPGPEA